MLYWTEFIWKQIITNCHMCGITVPWTNEIGYADTKQKDLSQFLPMGLLKRWCQACHTLKDHSCPIKNHYFAIIISHSAALGKSPADTRLFFFLLILLPIDTQFHDFQKELLASLILIAIIDLNMREKESGIHTLMSNTKVYIRM